MLSIRTACFACTTGQLTKNDYTTGALFHDRGTTPPFSQEGDTAGPLKKRPTVSDPLVRKTNAIGLPTGQPTAKVQQIPIIFSAPNMTRSISLDQKHDFDGIRSRNSSNIFTPKLHVCFLNPPADPGKRRFNLLSLSLVLVVSI